MFLAALDQTVILTALPVMLVDVRVPLTQLDDAAWLVSGYLLGFVSMLPLLGRVSDVYGRRPVYVISLAIFGAGSLACALAQNLQWLIAARVIQAVGGGALLPVTFALVADGAASARSLWFGVVGAVGEAGGVLGPLYGAAFVQQWGWRWIFWANLPLTAAITLAIVLTVPRKVHRERGLRYVDIPGAVALACVLAALTIALSGSSDPLRAASPVDLRRALPFGFLACVATVCFVVRERTAGRPLLPRQLATSAVFWTAGGVNFLVGAGLIAAMVDIPLFAATVLGRPPLAAGLALLRLTASIPFAAVAGGWLAQRTGPRFVAIAGLLLTAGGFWLMSRWSLTVTDGQMTPSLILTGLGFGLVIAPVTSVAVSATGTDQRATATSLVTVLRMAGMTVGLAALTSLAFFRFQILVAGLRLPLPSAGEPTTAFDARVAAYQAGISNAALNVFTGVFLLAAVICLAACAPAWWLAEADQT